jgi:hypothetical protein
MARVVVDAVRTPQSSNGCAPASGSFLGNRNLSKQSAHCGLYSPSCEPEASCDCENLDLSYSVPDPSLPRDERIFSAQVASADEEHRDKSAPSPCPYLGLVVRTIPPSSSEFHSKQGREAIDNEIEDLRKEGTWDEGSVKEWSEARNIKHNAFTPMSGLLFIIMGQKNSELVGTVPADQCPFRARAVFQGSNIRTGDGTPPLMLYQEVGAAPSNMATAHCVMGVGALQGCFTSTRDAKKACIQSFIDAPGHTWVD